MVSASRSVLSELVTPPFAVALLLLGGAALLAGPVAKRLQLKLTKQPLPLKKPLNSMDAEALGPYRVVVRHVLSPVILEALGTEKYLNWTLEDTSVPPSDPLRYMSLFVTYYTGGSNLVPHTPDVCYLGAGYAPGQGHENVDIEIPALEPGPSTVRVRLCTFVKTAVFNRSDLSVVYTFHCNGRFVNTRTGVRLLINDPRGTYSYFSKVEVSFPNATRAQSVEGTRKLFNRVLPVLVKDHWPDFEAAEMVKG